MTGMRTCVLLAIAALASQLWAQAAPRPVYVESFRNGSTHVAERTIVANLSGDNPKFTAKIKDSDNDDRYELSLVPQRVSEGDDRIVAWRVLLIDLNRKYLGNLLVATKPPGLLSDGLKDRAWWLDPSPYAVVPLRTKRVFKVEDFYCVVQVTDHRQTVPERLLLDFMKVEVEFTEANPLSGWNGAN